jgi:hypothetical protein
MSDPKLSVLPDATTRDELTILQEEHRQLYEKFLPTLNEYQDMAKRALELQISIFKLRLERAFPKASNSTRGHVLTISAREMLPNLEKLLAEVERQGVKVDHINYDPRTFSFSLFSNDSN